MGYLSELCGVDESMAEIRLSMHGRLMDRIYRSQRHIYDLTRRYYLLGRDMMIKQMEVRPGDRVLEVGCGTARNLIHVARQHPTARLYGLDVSAEMIKSARASLVRHRLSERVHLQRLPAETLHHWHSFGCEEPFDVIFFSYTLSMIPTWQAAVDAALTNLKPGRSLWVVDFWDQAELPRWFARLLRWWLARFHVQHRPELLEYFQQLQTKGRVRLTIQPMYRRYAYLARLQKAD